jgi:hypothetical protein
MKRILIVYFSQSGQLRRVVDSVSAPLLANAALQVTLGELRPRTPYPFPWPFFRFFDQFPETVQLQPPEIEALPIGDDEHFDLVVLAYTVWFLSPSPPVTAFLKSAQGRRILRDTPVVTLIACRNMWLMAQEQVRVMLDEAGARLSDNIVLTDAGSSLATFVTTPRWMMTGRKDSFLGLPAPGLQSAQIRQARRFGQALATALSEGRLDGRAPVLQGLQAAVVDDRLIASERIGHRSFRIWSRILRALGGPGSQPRQAGLFVYVVFLVSLIVTVVPLTMGLRVLLRPLLSRRLQRERAYYELPSGSGSEHMAGLAE